MRWILAMESDFTIEWEVWRGVERWRGVCGGAAQVLCLRG